MPLPAELRARLVRYAAKKQLKVATAARTLLDERLGELEEREGLSEVELWQRAQAWASWDTLKRGKSETLELDDVLKEFDRPRRPASRRRRR